MVIGNGLIASSFSDYLKNDEYIIFASGVSSSDVSSEDEFQREIVLIQNFFNTNKKFIYFSSSRYYIDKPYFLHKRKLEKLISENMKNYIIFRIPNVVGNGGNKNNIFNFFKEKIKNKENIDVINSMRSFVDIDDLKKICILCFGFNRQILTLSEIEKIKVLDLVKMIAEELNSVPVINFINKEEEYISGNSNIINEIIKNLEINVDGYNKKIIKKYI